MANKRFIDSDSYRKVFDKKLKPNQLTVLLVLLSYGINEVFVSVGRIAHESNYSRKNVLIILRELKNLEVLIRKGKTNFGTIIYSIDLDVLPDKPKYEGIRQKRRNASKSYEPLNEYVPPRNDNDDDIPF